MVLAFCRTNTTNNTNFMFFKITMSLVAAQTQSFSVNSGDPNVAENDTFQFGAMALTFIPQNPDGTAGTPITQGWNRVSNVSWNGNTGI